MVKALRAKGIPVAYMAFEGEQHGFRQAANIKRSLDGELYFYSRIFGFERHRFSISHRLDAARPARSRRCAP